MDLNYLIEGLLTLSTGVTAFFLRRTIGELDTAKLEIANLKERTISKDELNKCRDDIAKIKEDYITREDFFREQSQTRSQLDRIMDILLEMKGDQGNGR